jgi:hypothetical protein
VRLPSSITSRCRPPPPRWHAWRSSGSGGSRQRRLARDRRSLPTPAEERTRLATEPAEERKARSAWTEEQWARTLDASIGTDEVSERVHKARASRGADGQMMDIST